MNIGSNGKLIVDASVDDGQEGNLSTDVTGKITGEKGSTIHYVHVADKGVVRLNMKASRPLRSTTSLYKVVKVENEDNQYTFKIATGSELAGTGLEHFDGAALDGMADNEVIGSLLTRPTPPSRPAASAKPVSTALSTSLLRVASRRPALKPPRWASTRPRSVLRSATSSRTAGRVSLK